MEKDKYVGICKVGEKGQIVIPKEARDMFNINSGDSIIVLCNKNKGIALVKSDVIEDLADNILKKWGIKMKLINKQFRTSDNSIINYYELDNQKPILLIVHAQGNKCKQLIQKW